MANGYRRWGIGLALLAATTLRAQDIGLTVGKSAPSAVTVQSLDGKDVSLAQYVGKTPVVIEFWATWCPNCKELEPTLKSAMTKYSSRVKFVGIAVSVNENPARVKKFVEAHA